MQSRNLQLWEVGDQSVLSRHSFCSHALIRVRNQKLIKSKVLAKFQPKKETFRDLLLLWLAAFFSLKLKNLQKPKDGQHHHFNLSKLNLVSLSPEKNPKSWCTVVPMDGWVLFAPSPMQ